MDAIDEFMKERHGDAWKNREKSQEEKSLEREMEKKLAILKDMTTYTYEVMEILIKYEKACAAHVARGALAYGLDVMELDEFISSWKVKLLRLKENSPEAFKTMFEASERDEQDVMAALVVDGRIERKDMRKHLEGRRRNVTACLYGGETYVHYLEKVVEAVRRAVEMAEMR